MSGARHRRGRQRHHRRRARHGRLDGAEHHPRRPGRGALSGTVALGATTGGGAVRVEFSVSAANADTWTQIADDAVAPWRPVRHRRPRGRPLRPARRRASTVSATACRRLRARGRPARQHRPGACSPAAPADGLVSAAANQIVLTASEPVTAPGALLDGSAAPAPHDRRQRLPFPTGALADGCTCSRAELVDARQHARPLPRRRHDRKHPVGRSAAGRANITSSSNWTLTVPGGLVTVRMPERLAHAADAAGLHPRPPGRRRSTRRRVRTGHADRGRDRALGDCEGRT